MDQLWKDANHCGAGRPGAVSNVASLAVVLVGCGFLVAPYVMAAQFLGATQGLAPGEEWRTQRDRMRRLAAGAVLGAVALAWFVYRRQRQCRAIEGMLVGTMGWLVVVGLWSVYNV